MSKSPSLRRIQADVRELAHDPSDRYHASPLENDMFEWHFTIRGADGTDFEGGVYHGRILLPPEYPFKPPHIVFLTPSGRFETNTKVCLSFSAYHPELWQPAWGIRLILEALISFLPTPADGAIGALDWSSAERKKLAKQSQSFCCAKCGKIINLLPKEVKGCNNKPRFEKEIEQLRQLQIETEGTGNNNNKGDEEANKEKDDKDGDKKDSNEAAATEAAEEGDGSKPKAETAAAEVPQPAASADPGAATASQPEGSVATPTAASAPSNVASATAESKVAAAKPEAAIAVATATARTGQAPSTTASAGTAEPSNTVAAARPAADAAAIPAAAQAGTAGGDLSDPYWMLDPLLQCIAVLLAVICYLLIRKFNALLEELQMLQED